MAFKATKYFVVVVALVIAGTRYMNLQRKRLNLNNEIGVWDTEAKDGLRYTIITRSNETGGKFFVAHVFCTSKAQGFYPGRPCSPPQHIHDTQDEEFEVISGVLLLDWNGTVVQIPVGQKATVPAGLPHTFGNGGSEPLELIVKMTPGLPDEGFLEMVAALSQQFGSLSKINPMQLVLLFADYNITMTEVPKPLWSAAKKFLVPLARLLGFRSHYPSYVSKSGQPQPVELKQPPQQEQAPAGDVGQHTAAETVPETAAAAEAVQDSTTEESVEVAPDSDVKTEL